MQEHGQDDGDIGEVLDLGALDLGAAAPEEGPARRVERTRALLAYLLLLLLAGIMATLLFLLGTRRLTTPMMRRSRCRSSMGSV